MKRLLLLCLLLTAPAFQALAAAEVAMVTALQGKVDGASGAMEAFAKLRKGDVLTLAGDARLQIVYFENGRQEAWSGKGRLEIQETEASATGLAAPAVKQLPLVMVKQLARTPSLDSQGRAGAIRLRSIPTPEAIARVDANYRKMRAESAAEDLNPEMYLLAGMFELGQTERVEAALGDLGKRPEPEAKLLVALYQKALRNQREASGGNHSGN